MTERTGQAVTGAHRNGPQIMAGHAPVSEELVGSEKPRGSSALHERDREVAANAVAGHHDPRVRRADGKPLLPGPGVPEWAVILDQPFVGNDRRQSRLGIDAIQLSQQPLLQHVLVCLISQRVRVQLDD